MVIGLGAIGVWFCVGDELGDEGPGGAEAIEERGVSAGFADGFEVEGDGDEGLLEEGRGGDLVSVGIEGEAAADEPFSAFEAAEHGGSGIAAVFFGKGAEHAFVAEEVAGFVFTEAARGAGAGDEDDVGSIDSEEGAEDGVPDVFADEDADGDGAEGEEAEFVAGCVEAVFVEDAVGGRKSLR